MTQNYDVDSMMEAFVLTCELIPKNTLHLYADLNYLTI